METHTILHVCRLQVLPVSTASATSNVSKCRSEAVANVSLCCPGSKSCLRTLHVAHSDPYAHVGRLVPLLGVAVYFFFRKRKELVPKEPNVHDVRRAW